MKREGMLRMSEEGSPELESGFTERPADWPDATRHFERAHTLTMTALTGEMSRDRFKRYYRTDGNYAGVTVCRSSRR